MQSSVTEKLLVKILTFGAALTTVFIISEGVTDPVNATKLMILGIVSCSAFGLSLSTVIRRRLVEQPWILGLIFLFWTVALFSTLQSSTPLTQNLYGVYGRNNGLLTYLFLGIIFLVSTSIRTTSEFRFVPISLMIAGGINLIYCLWVILFGDFIGWTNPYGNILGTLGNPNFIGSFLGIIFSVGFSWILNRKYSQKSRFLLAAILALCAFEIIESSAIQGRVVALFGSSIVLFLFLRSRTRGLLVACYSIAVTVLGFISLLGALQIGPLTQYIYKNSVSLRGQYWQAALNTGKNNPISGVGMDAFGDWYRRMRDSHALELPGVNTVVNAAHNVPLDFFAFGGLPLFVSYLLLMAAPLPSIFRTLKRTKTFDPVFSAMLSAWAGYHLQSIISINQIGLAVWGWLLSGCLIAYEKSLKLGLIPQGQHAQVKKNLRSNQSQRPGNIVSVCVGALLGLLISIPPLSADMKWRGAQKARTLESLVESMQVNYFNPANSMKYGTNIQTLEQSGFYDLSRKYALIAVDWNPNSFELWKLVYQIRDTTTQEKNEALENLRRLDPLNPDVTA